jgi:hypothetical protein
MRDCFLETRLFLLIRLTAPRRDTVPTSLPGSPSKGYPLLRPGCAGQEVLSPLTPVVRDLPKMVREA